MTARPRRRAPLPLAGVVAWACLLGAPKEAAAQVPVSVTGRVVQAEGGQPIPLAVVELEGFGAMLATEDGEFRFDGVEPAGYTLRVTAFGYVAESRFLVVDADTAVEVELRPSPLVLDSVQVELRAVDVRGEVRDPLRDFGLVDIPVLTDQGANARTDANGDFELEGVLEDVPLHVTIRAFGYLPIDSVIHPRAAARYLFEVEPDPVVEAMVERQVERLARRAAPRFAVGFRNMNRTALLRYAERHTLWDVLLWEYGERKLDRVICVVMDEEPFDSGAVARSMLLHTLPAEVERIEFMFGGAMLRVYTRSFMQQMIARDVPLRRPSLFRPFPSSPPLCS